MKNDFEVVNQDEFVSIWGLDLQRELESLRTDSELNRMRAEMKERKLDKLAEALAYHERLCNYDAVYDWLSTLGFDANLTISRIEIGSYKV